MSVCMCDIITSFVNLMAVIWEKEKKIDAFDWWVMYKDDNESVMMIWTFHMQGREREGKGLAVA